MQEKNNLLILGAGAWGSALALVASQHADRVYVWDHDPQHIETIIRTGKNKYLANAAFPKNIYFTADLAAACADSQDILVVVASVAVREVLQNIKPFFADEMSVTVASKGLDAATGNLFHIVIKEVLGENTAIGVLSGPSFASEVARGLPTAVTFASDSAVLCTRMLQRLNTSYFRVYHSTDVVGVELGGLVKNVIAIATGIVDGLALGANARSALITRGLAEMMRLGEALGARTETLAGLSGVGDLILTCTDNQSRNHRFGVKIGQGLSTQEALQELACLVEGVQNVPLILKLAERYKVSLPISEQVYEVLYHGKSPRDSLHDLLAREIKAE